MSGDRVPVAAPATSARATIAIFTSSIIVVSFLDTMTQLPILSPFVVSLGAGATYTGVILGSYSLVNMVGNVLAGPVIDTRGSRVTIVVGMLIAGAAVAGYAAVTRPWQLLVLRLVHGAGGAILIPAVFAWAGDRTQQSGVSRSMGYAGAAVAFAAMAGPALGGIVGSLLGARAVFLLLGLILGIAAFVMALQPDPVDSRSRDTSPGAAGNPDTGPSIRAALNDGALRYACGSAFSLTFTLGTLAYAFPLTMGTHGYSPATTGLFLSVFSIAAILLLILPTNRIMERFHRSSVIVAGALLVTPALLVLGFEGAGAVPALLVAIMVLYGLGFGAVYPTTCAVVVDVTDPGRRGTAFGLYYAVFSLGVFLGPIVAGAINATFRSGHAGAYWSAAALVLFVQAIAACNR